MMRYLFFLRFIFVILGVVFFFVFSRRLSKRNLRGIVLAGMGISLIALNLLVGLLYHSELLLSASERERLLPILGTVSGLFGQTLGIVLLLLGVYRLIQSVEIHLDPYYLSLVEKSFVGVFLIKDGVFEFVNPRFAEIFEYRREELVGKPAVELVDGSKRGDAAKRLANLAMWENDPVQTELTGRKKGGGKTQLEVIASVISHYGRPAIHGTVIDISDRKQALEVILAGEERFRTLANSSHDIISESTQDGTLVYLSENTKELLGYEYYELLNMNVLNLMHPDDSPAIAKQFKRSFTEGTSARSVFRYRTKSGDWRWFEGSGQPYETGSGEKRVVVVSRDISNRKRMEEEILKASKLESIGVLAGGIAHDFNNILTVILGNISFAKSFFETEAEEPAQVLSEAEKACARAQRLTNQLLTFSKGGTPVIQTTSIAHFLRETVDFTLHGSSVRCDYHLDDDLWLVDIDEGQVRQVFHNLIINAMQAMPEGGLLEIHGRNWHEDSDNGLPLKEGDFVKITLRDHGCGIPAANMTKIFDPYFTTKENGTGLGLATAYSIIKNHNGLLTVDSEVGLGTQFHVFLPTGTRTREPAAAPVRVGIPIKPSMKILLMDDEDTIRRSVGRMLNRLGYRVELAEDGDRALQLFRQAREADEPYDIVLLDLTIRGGMGGKETMENLLSIDPEVKAVVSSGYSHDPIMADFRKYGFSGVIAKPYRFDSLGEVLNEVAAGA